MRYILLSVSCIIVFSSFVKGQVPGDECPDALDASLTSPNYFDTSNATPSSVPDPDESMCPGTYLNWDGSPDFWFTFTPAISDTYNFTTCNVDSYDTSMVIYKGICSNLIQIACNGDSLVGSGSCQEFYSEIETSLIGGTQYFVRIGGYGGETGYGELSIENAGGNSGGTTWFVDQDMSASGNGGSWSTAFQTIDEALLVAVNSDQIWIAEGTYIPTTESDVGDPRSVSFYIRQAIDFYGGFNGTETTLDERDLSLHHTILTADLLGDDVPDGTNTDENAYHVIASENVSTGSVLIDGFWIHGGNANVATDKFGGGILVDTTMDVPIIVKKCWIQGNNALAGGAIAVLSTTADLQLIKVKIKNNRAENEGAGLFSRFSVAIDTCEITGNSSAQGLGGGMIVSGDLAILNTTVSQNSARLVGGIDAYGTSINVENSILWGNISIYGDSAQVSRNTASMTARYSCIENLESDLVGNGNIDLNPCFVNALGLDGQAGTGDEDYRLFQGSPCIDAGDNTLVIPSRDLDGNVRFIDDPYTTDTGNNPTGLSVSDMGPFELVPADINTDGVRIWSGQVSDTFHDYLNWLPLDVPSTDDTALFNSTGTVELTLKETTYLNALNVSDGIVKFNLAGNYIELRNTLDADSNWS